MWECFSHNTATFLIPGDRCTRNCGFCSVAHGPATGPDVFNHNIETVPRLYPAVKPQADSERSLTVLEIAKKIDPKIITKSGIMLGLGEKEQEVFQTFQDLINVGCPYNISNSILPELRVPFRYRFSRHIGECRNSEVLPKLFERLRIIICLHNN
jgi:lipoate synthase